MESISVQGDRGITIDTCKEEIKDRNKRINNYSYSIYYNLFCVKLLNNRYHILTFH